jgi:hypothetical protein
MKGDGIGVKQGPGALPPGPPLRARPLEPFSFRQGEGCPGQISGTTEAAPSPCLKLVDFKGSAFNGVQGQSPWPSSTPVPITPS